jgi:hypothetical protein
MAETVAYKFRAFISYSHADTCWAKWLHRALEGFRIDKDLVGRETATGTIPKSLRPIFRDRDDFTAGHTLTDQTLAALNASHALIVICSPSAAKSEYVTEEIRLFKSRHPDRPVIPLIVDGKPGDTELECFPPSRPRYHKRRVYVFAVDDALKRIPFPMRGFTLIEFGFRHPAGLENTGLASDRQGPRNVPTPRIPSSVDRRLVVPVAW